MTLKVLSHFRHRERVHKAKMSGQPTPSRGKNPKCWNYYSNQGGHRVGKGVTTYWKGVY